MKLISFLMIGSLIAPLLLQAESQSWSGFFNGGGEEVYTAGNEHYCIVPVNDTSVKFTLDMDGDDDSCVYLTLGSVKESECGDDPVLELDNVPGRMYKVVVAPKTPSDNIKYTITAEYDDGGVFGRCTDYYYAGYLSMTIEGVNMILAFGGVLIALLFFGALTYIFMTLGNF